MLMLLACGKARTELKEFLIEELTEKVSDCALDRIAGMISIRGFRN